MGKKRSKSANPGEEGGDALGEGAQTAEHEEWDSDFEGPPPSKRQTASVTDEGIPTPLTIVSPAADLFYGAAPPKVDKPSRPRRSKKKEEVQADADATEGRGRKEAIPDIPKRVTQTGGTGRGLMKVHALKASDTVTGAGGAGPEEEGHSKRGHRSTEGGRHGEDNRDMRKETKKRRKGEHSAPRQGEGKQPVPIDTRRPNPQRTLHPETSPSRGNEVTEFHVQSRKPQTSGQERELRLPTVTRYPVSVWVEDTIRVASKGVTTVEESFFIAASLGAARALHEKYSRCHVTNQLVTLEPSPSDVEIHQVSRGTVLADKCVTNADGLKDIEGEEHDDPTEEHEYFKDGLGWDVVEADRGEGSDPVAVLSSDRTLEAAVSEMRVWDETLAENAELQHYWAEGKGFPEPFMFQPEMEKRFLKREEELQRHERAYVALEQRRADEAIQALKIPPAPEKPPVPALYHLQTFEGSVTLPWSWDHETGDSFRRAWEECYPTREFQDQLMGCLWWWTSKKVRCRFVFPFLGSDTTAV